MRKLLAAALLLMGFSIVAFAQQNEGRNAPSRAGGGLIAGVPETDSRPYSRAITGTVVRVDTENNEIVVNQPKTGAIRFALSKDTKIKADKNAGLTDRRDFSLADYKPGQTVKVTYRLADNKVLEIRLKPAKQN